MPHAEYTAAEPANADNFFDKDGIFAKFFANTLESMMTIWDYSDSLVFEDVHRSDTGT